MRTCNRIGEPFRNHLSDHLGVAGDAEVPKPAEVATAFASPQVQPGRRPPEWSVRTPRVGAGSEFDLWCQCAGFSCEVRVFNPFAAVTADRSLGNMRLISQWHGQREQQGPRMARFVPVLQFPGSRSACCQLACTRFQPIQSIRRMRTLMTNSLQPNHFHGTISIQNLVVTLDQLQNAL